MDKYPNHGIDAFNRYVTLWSSFQKPGAQKALGYAREILDEKQIQG